MPKHPHGGCSLARHGTYERKTPEGVRVARWYCHQSHATFSLLPDCLAARLPSTLDRLEGVVVAAEGAMIGRASVGSEGLVVDRRADSTPIGTLTCWIRADYEGSTFDAGQHAGSAQVGYNEPDARVQLTRMPLDLGDGAAGLVPGRGLIAEAGMIPANRTRAPINTS